MDRLMGVETEYAVAGPGGRGEAAQTLLRVAGARLKHLPGYAGGLYLANGARLYLDSGSHPEYCTPECGDPTEAVRHVLAGERILESLLSTPDPALPHAHGTTLFKHNVDPLADTTWACHESYLVRRPPAEFASHLIPHLVSRIVYTGAGGFLSRGEGWAFTLSPRAWFLEVPKSGSSTNHRGIFHLKDETLSRGTHHRLHLICGESLCSEIATWLKLGTTALVVALIDAGHVPGRTTRPRDPVAALRAFAADPAGRARVSMQAGRPAGAIEIQRRLLEFVLSHGDAPELPEWAAPVCREWGVMLDRLEAGPEAVERTLDWAIKRRLFLRHVERRGVAWDSLQMWSRVAEAVQPGPPRAELGPVASGSADAAGRAEARGEGRARLRAARGRLRGILELCRELSELEVRYGELSARGVFRSLDRAGALNHRMTRDQDVERACERAPDRGRARLRAEAVRAHAGASGYHADWQAVWDSHGRRLLDLGDPFAATAEWKRSAGPPRLRSSPVQLAEMLDLFW